MFPMLTSSEETDEKIISIKSPVKQSKSPQQTKREEIMYLQITKYFHKESHWIGSTITINIYNELYMIGIILASLIFRR